jgi:hypothetical protein
LAAPPKVSIKISNIEVTKTTKVQKGEDEKKQWWCINEKRNEMHTLLSRGFFGDAMWTLIMLMLMSRLVV